MAPRNPKLELVRPTKDMLDTFFTPPCKRHKGSEGDSLAPSSPRGSAHDGPAVQTVEDIGAAALFKAIEANDAQSLLEKKVGVQLTKLIRSDLYGL